MMVMKKVADELRKSKTCFKAGAENCNCCVTL